MSKATKVESDETNHKANEEGNQKNESKGKQTIRAEETLIKPIRRIKQRTQIPTDKAELIQYLSQRIRQAQEALNDTEQLLEAEVLQRQKVTRAIDDRNNQLQKLYKVDQKGLPHKIKEKLTQILTQTVRQKIQAEQQLQVEKNRNYEFRSRFEQLKWEESISRTKLQTLAEKQQTLEQHILQETSQVETHESQLKQVQGQLEVMKQKKNVLQNKYLQLKVALERMTDISSVLNRFFANQDLFDEKMDMKEQKVKKIQYQQQDNSPYSSKINMLQSRQNRNITKLKPLENSRRKQTKADDQDFWRGDFSSKNQRNF